MSYTVNFGSALWSGGAFCIPAAVVEKSLKFADELQLKVLMLILSDGGKIDVHSLSEKLRKSEDEIVECLDFWCQEGVVSSDSEAPLPVLNTEEKQEDKKPSFESLPMPNLTPRDVVAICSDNAELADLLRTAEMILASSISHSMKSNLINMVTYYGLPAPVVVTLLEYCKSERDSGRNVSTRRLQQIAKEWANEEVDSIEEASRKISELAAVDDLWVKTISLCELDYIKPTSAQKKMLARWLGDFDGEMIAFACNTMKKYTDEEKRSIKVVDNILKEWKRKGFKTPDEVKAQPKKEEKKPDKKGKLKSEPSFDIEEIKRRSVLNDDYNI